MDTMNRTICAATGPMYQCSWNQSTDEPGTCMARIRELEAEIAEAQAKLSCCNCDGYYGNELASLRARCAKLEAVRLKMLDYLTPKVTDAGVLNAWGESEQLRAELLAALDAEPEKESERIPEFGPGCHDDSREQQP